MWKLITDLWKSIAAPIPQAEPTGNAGAEPVLAVEPQQLDRNHQWHRLFESLAQANATIPERKSRRVQVGQLEICLSRVPQGFFAVQDSCPHLGASLSSGTCNYLGEVICPWHSYRFSLLSGEESTGHGLQVAQYPVVVRPDGVYLGIPATGLS